MPNTKNLPQDLVTFDNHGDIISFTTSTGIKLTVGEQVISNGKYFASSGSKGILRMIYNPPKENKAIYEVKWEGALGSCAMKIKYFDLKAMGKI